MSRGAIKTQLRALGLIHAAVRRRRTTETAEGGDSDSEEGSDAGANEHAGSEGHNSDNGGGAGAGDAADNAMEDNEDAPVNGAEDEDVHFDATFRSALKFQLAKFVREYQVTVLYQFLFAGYCQ